MPALLSRLFRRVLPSAGSSPEPAPFGPVYETTGTDRVSVKSGPLAGAEFRLEGGVAPTKADFALHALSGDPGTTDAGRDPAAHCHFDRRPDSGEEILWDIVVRPDFRHRGLSTLLVRLTFRKLLEAGNRHTFSMRNLMKVDTEVSRYHLSAPARDEDSVMRAQRITLQNLGIGVLAVRLGFRPEPAAEQMLSPGKVKSVEVLDPDPPIPPGLLLRLDTLPGLVVAAVLDPETLHPVAEKSHYERFVSPSQLLRQAVNGTALLGNIDYVLPRAAIPGLAARLADTRAEARRFAAALERGAGRGVRN
jgi:GNAT superfamily N-acetyltransferase